MVSLRIPPQVRAMLATSGFYVVHDAKLPGALTPILSADDQLFKIVVIPDEPLDPTRFLPGITIEGPVRPMIYRTEGSEAMPFNERIETMRFAIEVVLDTPAAVAQIDHGVLEMLRRCVQ